MAISLTTINVNGMAEHHKRVKVFELLRSFKHNIFFLQETHLTDALQGKAWEKEWGEQAAWSPGSNRSAGVAVLVHPSSAVKLADQRVDLAGRVVTVKLSFHNQFFQAHNVYAPNVHREREIFSTIYGVISSQT